MNPFETLTAFWTAQGQGLQQAQAQMAEGMKAMMSGTLPAMPGGAADIATAADEMARAGYAVTELWQAANAMAARIASQFPNADPLVADTFLKIVDPHAWLAGTSELQDVMNHAAEGPRFADLWEIERRHLRVAKAWLDVRRTGLAHNAVVLRAWLQAGEKFAEEFAGRNSAQAKAADAKAMTALWTETANRALIEAQRSDEFLATQTAAVRATTELNLAQQDLGEFFGKQYGFPTRTELDDVHRSLTELRREVRALKRKLRDGVEVI